MTEKEASIISELCSLGVEELRNSTLIDQIVPGYRLEGLEKIEAINGIPLAKLEVRMRPGNRAPNGSITGFLGDKERLIDTLERDGNYVRSCGYKHSLLALPLFLVKKTVGRKQHELMFNGRRFTLNAMGSFGKQESPFDDGTSTSTDFIVTDSRGKELVFSGLLPEMIARYGFYEGNVPHRLTPGKIINFFYA